MSASAASPKQLAFNESQKRALLTLLTDDDLEVYYSIRNTIVEQGAGARDWLKDHALSSDPVLRRRSQEIVDHFERRDADNSFLIFCLKNGEDLDVERGAWLLSKTQYPQINISAYHALLDSYAGDLKDRIDFGARPDRILATINYYIYQEQKFLGNVKDYYDPDNSYLSMVVDRKMGNPISLSLLYILVARRLHLPVAGIGMPGHFICRFQSSREEIYIDPFRKGKLMTKGECMKILIHSGHDYHEGFLSPVTPRQILKRMCSNLHHTYTTHDMADEAMRLQRYMVALSK